MSEDELLSLVTLHSIINVVFARFEMLIHHPMALDSSRCCKVKRSRVAISETHDVMYGPTYSTVIGA